MFTPDLDHGGGWFQTLVEDSDRAITETCNEDVACDLVGSQGCDAGARTCGDILMIYVSREKEGRVSVGGSYVRAHFSSGIPDTNDLNVTGDKSLTLALLPIEHQACIAIAGNQLGKGPESRDHLDVLISFVMAEKLDNTVGGAGHEECLVIFVDVSNLIDLRAGRVAI